MSVYKSAGRSTWTVQVNRGAGRRPVRRYGLATKSMAQQLEAKLKFQVEAERHGLIDAKDARIALSAAVPLAKHIDDYADHLRAKGDSAKYVTECRVKVAAMFAAARVPTIADIDRHRLLKVCDDLRATHSVRTRNKALTAVQGFVGFLYDHERIATHPLLRVKRMNEDLDPHLRRREMTDAEIRALIDASAAGPVRGGMTGRDRAVRYALAIGTGLRQGTLFALTPEQFHLDAKPPHIDVPAGQSKGRKAAKQLLRADLATLLRGWLRGKPAGAPVFPRLPCANPTTAFRRDMEAAGVQREQGGTVLDQHALRHTAITRWVRAGNLAAAQELAHHSTPLLTKRYAHPDANDFAKALAGLPPVRANLRANGTKNGERTRTATNNGKGGK